jgi:predicted metal-dependent enzyme (double-stranded beta helix superfamily)
MGIAGQKPASNGDVAGLDGPVRLLFERIAGPAAAETPDLEAVRAAIVHLATDLDYMMRWVERLGAAGGSLPIHAPARGPRLAIVHRLEGQMSAVHDHATWVAISTIVGCETHRRYTIVRQDPTVLPELVEVLTLEASDVATLLPPDDVHDHGHLPAQGTPAFVLILTGDDQRRFARNEWDLASGRHRILQPGDSGRWLASEPIPAA